MKCYKGNLILYDESEVLTVYTFHINGQQESEVDRFFERFTEPKYSSDVNKILSAYEAFIERGIDRRRFRSKGEQNIDAIASGDCNLRLYCIPCGKHLIIYGNGGEKTDRTTQLSPDCNPHWDLLSKIEIELVRRIQEGEVRYLTNKDGDYIGLEGDLYFEIDCD